MTFNKECKYLDLKRMKSDEITVGSKGRIHKPGLRRYYHPCLSEENPDDWISECPNNCPYFQPLETK
jgi:hypothetical protein